MFPIVKQEFTNSFKSVKAILLILFLTITSVFTASYLTRHPELLAGVNQPSAYTSSIKFFILFFGFLFVCEAWFDDVPRYFSRDRRTDHRSLVSVLRKMVSGTVSIHLAVPCRHHVWNVITVTCFMEWVAFDGLLSHVKAKGFVT